MPDRPIPTDPRALRPVGAARPGAPPQEPAPAKRTRTHGISAALLAYLQNNSGRTINMAELERGFPDFAPASMRAAIRGLVTRVEESQTGTIRVVIQGQAWQYNQTPTLHTLEANPEPADLPLPSEFERIGIQTDGALVLRDENGMLWKAVLL